MKFMYYALQRTLIIAYFVIIALSVCAGVANAKPTTVSGAALVVDGDTLEVAGIKVRIHGIDAPESHQTCQRDGVEWLCGKEANKAMRNLVLGVELKCEPLDRDRYGRIIGRCKANGRDVGDAMVSMGLAMAYRRYSEEYILAEEAAKESKKGLWSGQFVSPWDWRQGKRLVPSPANDNQACLIKGNISRSGERIFHIPSGLYYSRTKISPERGERYFCSEAEAVSAGWRRSRQ